jgi:hypothetical protein
MGKKLDRVYDEFYCRMLDSSRLLRLAFNSMDSNSMLGDNVALRHIRTAVQVLKQDNQKSGGR